MSDETMWIERAQAAEAQLATMRDQIYPLKEKIQQFKTNFGVREDSEGRIHIDYDRFVESLGPEACLELRRIIDEKWRIRGKPGEKPKIRVA